jgi:glycosyltransferase involved in cell wall biosynthesis
MNSPLVSVVIIFLNGEPFIAEAIASVFAQTYGNWELLLVDDGSTDDSTAIAQCYAQQHPDKVRYLEHAGHQNRGMSTSRNLGVSHAQGKYIALLDADDVWFSQKLEQQVAILEANPKVDMVYGSALWWYSWTGKSEDAARDCCDFVDRYVEQPNGLIEPPDLLPLFLANGGVPCPSTVLIRYDVLAKIGGFEDSFRGMFEDYAFYSKLGLVASVLVSDQCWIKYRRHDASAYQISLDTGQEFYSKEIFLNWLEQYMINHNVTDLRIWRTLRSQLLPYRNPALFTLKRGLRFIARKVRATQLG